MKLADITARWQGIARALLALVLIGVGVYLRRGLADSLLAVGILIWVDLWLEGMIEAWAGRKR